MRLRRHNGELVGGAKRTRAGRPWVPLMIISGFESWQQTLQFEGRLKIAGKKRKENATRNPRSKIFRKVQWILNYLGKFCTEKKSGASQEVPVLEVQVFMKNIQAIHSYGSGDTYKSQLSLLRKYSAAKLFGKVAKGGVKSGKSSVK